MTIGSAAEDIGLTILLLLPALLTPMILLGAGVLIARALKLPGIVAVFLTIGAITALLVGGALAIEQAGKIVPAIVDRHSEHVETTAQGTWRHEYSVQLRYRLDGGIPSLEQPTATESAATLSPPPAHFDRLAAGAPTEVRVLPLYRSLALVRLGETSIAESLPWLWIGFALGAPVLFWIVRLLAASNAGMVALVVVALIAGGGIPAAQGYLAWQTSGDFASRPLRARAQVSEVTRITYVDPFPCRPGGRSRCARRNTTYDVAQPYDIVELRFTPENARGPIIAVDAVDATAAPLSPGDQVEIAYAASDSRAALIMGASHTHYWRNAVIPAVLAAVVALLIAAGLIYANRQYARSRQRRLARQQRPTISGA